VPDVCEFSTAEAINEGFTAFQGKEESAAACALKVVS